MKYQIDYIIGEECVWTVVSADLKAKYIQLAMDLVPDYVSFFTKYRFFPLFHFLDIQIPTLKAIKIKIYCILLNNSKRRFNCCFLLQSKFL